MKSLLVIVAVTALWTSAAASCNFPSALIGKWRSSVRNQTIEFTQDKLYGFQIDIFTHVNFHCYLNYNGKYAFASDNENLFSYKVRIYFCWSLVQVNENKFIYYELTGKARRDADDRGLAFLVSEVPYPSMSLVCEKEGQTPIVLTRVAS